MDIELIIQTYQTELYDTPLFRLTDTRLVVGEAIDENNHLFYIIKNDAGIYTVEDAQGKDIADFLHEIKPIINTHTSQSTE